MDGARETMIAVTSLLEGLEGISVWSVDSKDATHECGDDMQNAVLNILESGVWHEPLLQETERGRIDPGRSG